VSTPHILVIFDNISTIPLTKFFKELLRNANTHVIITFNPTHTPKDLIKTIDRELIRGTNTIDLKPLSSLLTTQRLVHSIMKGCDTDDFIPYNEEQKMISHITEQTGGSPDIIDVTSTVLAERLAKGDVEQRRGILQEFCEETVVANSERSQKEEAPKPAEAEARIEPDSTVISTESVARKSQAEEKVTLNQTTVVRFTTNLLQSLDLAESDYFLLKALHWFGTTPIPRQLIEILQSIIVSASKHQRPTKTPIVNLLSYKLLRVYPSTVVVKPSKSQLPYSSTHAHTAAASLSTDFTTSASFIADSDFYYVPQLVIDSVQDQLQPMDRDFSLTAAFKALSHYCKESDCDLTHATGLANVLYNKIDEDNACFQVAYRLYLSLVTSN
jgi:hypothetical protein